MNGTDNITTVANSYERIFYMQTISNKIFRIRKNIGD
jgi:hypothetical protein